MGFLNDVFNTAIQTGQNLKEKENAIREKAEYMTDKQLASEVRRTRGYEKMVYMQVASERGLTRDDLR